MYSPWAICLEVRRPRPQVVAMVVAVAGDPIQDAPFLAKGRADVYAPSTAEEKAAIRQMEFAALPRAHPSSALQNRDPAFSLLLRPPPLQAAQRAAPVARVAAARL